MAGGAPMLRAMGKGQIPGRAAPPNQAERPVLRPVLRLTRRALAIGALAVVAALALVRFVDPPITHTIWAEQRRLGTISHIAVPIEAVAPVARRAIVAAEDANFCTHWGFDMAAIRAAIEAGGRRGASTISQQVVKNVFLWQGRNWGRKALEAGLTPLAEAAWPKRRILELYLNVAEFGEGIFGIEAAARHHFGVSAADLSGDQAARLAVLLPSPRTRDPARLSGALRARAAQVLDGAETIRRDGRASCFDG